MCTVVRFNEHTGFVQESTRTFVGEVELLEESGYEFFNYCKKSLIL